MINDRFNLELLSIVSLIIEIIQIKPVARNKGIRKELLKMSFLSMQSKH